jgi:hypothetical protein
VQPDERSAPALSAGRHQDIHRLEYRRAAQAVVHQGDRAGDKAAGPGVEQGRHFLLRQVGRPGYAQVDAGQERLPRAARPDAPLHRVVLHAEDQQLPAADHGELLV